MKNIIVISIFFLSSITSIAQGESTKEKADSLSYVSRGKADLVLSHFDSIRTEKMLYSISDEQYYVILKEGCCYKEYYVHTDGSGNIIEQRTVKASKKNKKLLARAFNLVNYHTEFIRKVDNATVDQGNSSYFVLKDVDGKRYGEYSLSVITKPIPIDQQLYTYLLTRLLKESTKNNEAP
ncbi:MAG: hypothetical protein JST17_10985 [Bacteroidetes bacterium]|nr:hypothetical protein [Bacteroidota bacterium]